MSTIILQQLPTDRNHQDWAFRIERDGAVLFDSSSLGVRLKSRDGAEWVARIIDALLATSPLPEVANSLWTGDLDDDCQFHDGTYFAHAEHLTGAKRGGVWYCSVVTSVGTQRLFHTADFPGIEPKSGLAARRLCTLIICAASRGIVQPDAA